MNLKPRQNIFYLIIFLCILFGGGFNLQKNYTENESPDMLDYIHMSQGDFDRSPIRRYRWIVPKAAGTLNHFLSGSNKEDSPNLRFSFFITNLTIMGFCGLLLLWILLHLQVTTISALVSCCLLLATRWGIYFTALPLVDSLYLLCSLAFLYALLSGNKLALWLSLLLGPLSKESFFLWLSLLFLAPHFKHWKTLLPIFAGIGIFVANRLLIDNWFSLSQAESVESDLKHFTYILISLKKIFSLKGTIEIFMILGPLWILVIREWIQQRRKPYTIPTFIWGIVIIALFHALISTSIGRMLFLALPFWGWWLGQNISRILNSSTFQKN